MSPTTIKTARRSARCMAVPPILYAVLLCAGPVYGQATCMEPSGQETTENYCYDSLGRLIEQRRTDGTNAEFDYDDADNRTGRELDNTANMAAAIMGARSALLFIR